MKNGKIRVAILSLNMYTQDLNCACRVHSYAFQHFLEQHGIEAVILDYFPQHGNQEFDMRHPLNYYKQFPDPNPTVQKAHISKWTNLFAEREERYDKLQNFIDKYLKKSDVPYTTHMLDYFDPDFDIYVAATDVLWKYRDETGFDKGFFLQSNSMKGKGKITYAVSYGIKYDAPKIREVSDLIRDIDYISVREKWLYDTLKKVTNKQLSIVLDPVFLQPVEFYNEFIETPKEKDYVLVYNVIKNSKSMVDTAVRYANSKGLSVIELSSYKENENYPAGTNHRVIYGTGVEDWLGYIKNAECIFTNSFHGCCFSIIFNKKFYVGERGGTKIPWLLEVFNLEDRWVEPSVDVSLLEKPIDYEKVNKLVSLYVEKSSQYILKAIASLSEDIKNKNEQYGIMDFSSKKSTITISYNSSPKGNKISPSLNDTSWLKGTLKTTKGGSLEYSEAIYLDQKNYTVRECPFVKNGCEFTGWSVRARKKADDDWNVLCYDNNWINMKDITDQESVKILTPGNNVNLSEFNKYKKVILVANWKNVEA